MAKKGLMDLEQYQNRFCGSKSPKPEESIGTNTDQDASKIEKMANAYKSLDPDYLKKMKPKKMIEHLLKYAKDLIREAKESEQTTAFTTDNSVFNADASIKNQRKGSPAPDIKFCKTKSK